MSLIIKNTTGSDITLNTLGGIVIPLGGQLDVTAFITEEEFKKVFPREIVSHVLAGDIVINNGTDLTAVQATEFATDSSQLDVTETKARSWAGL